MHLFGSGHALVQCYYCGMLLQPLKQASLCLGFSLLGWTRFGTHSHKHTHRRHALVQFYYCGMLLQPQQQARMCTHIHTLLTMSVCVCVRVYVCVCRPRVRRGTQDPGPASLGSCAETSPVQQVQFSRVWFRRLDRVQFRRLANFIPWFLCRDITCLVGSIQQGLVQEA